ncbi:polyadenylate-binding protein-interacting protein 6-like [Iris pallida]|uniref:Polyadenylate-binding protein-interacting protein 6-like n=1 Tax=Iris pallida TaxID=29817 RepID=A0AAX6HDJ3_IRIPA|nr:polyadenylate-binding protein-interacting protein 6-like [Iris pallida]KAJ6853663.1 polyadenylate-binding protein-interacting protein 6-like [Iris pallida]
MQGKFLLNPHATPYVPLQKNLPGVNGGDDDKASKKTSEISDNSEDVGMARSCQLPASASVQVSDELFSKMNQFSFLNEESDMMDDLDSLSTMFPNYSTECLIELLNANQGDLRNTVVMLEELEDDSDVTRQFPASSEVHDNLVPACQKSDSAQPSSSTCPSRSSAQG